MALEYMKPLHIIQAPSNLGLIEPSPGKEPGVKHLPSALLQNGFADKLHITEVSLLEPPLYTMNAEEPSKVRNAQAIKNYSIRLSDVLYKKVKENIFPIIVGGDCSLLLGSMPGFRKAGNYGLFYIDGHTDYMLPHQSGTAGAAGMDLAFATGNGHEALSNINGLKPYVQEENVYCFGNREYTPWYVKLIEQSEIHYYDLNSIRVTGIENITSSFLKMIRQKDLTGFFIHLDADVLDDDLMPCVDSRQPGGLSYGELNATLSALLLSPFAAGMEITILDPTLDESGIYTKQFCDEMIKVFKESFRINN